MTDRPAPPVAIIDPANYVARLLPPLLPDAEPEPEPTTSGIDGDAVLVVRTPGGVRVLPMTAAYQDSDTGAVYALGWLVSEAAEVPPLGELRPAFDAARAERASLPETVAQAHTALRAADDAL